MSKRERRFNDKLDIVKVVSRNAIEKRVGQSPQKENIPPSQASIVRSRPAVAN
jgi:hypothetical protein